jgi:phosphoribosylformylglycinamidine synthase
MAVADEILNEIALSRAEYDKIVLGLGREPNGLELGMFGALWSEHCGYKHSKLLLRELPSESPRLLVQPGQENAGVIEIGQGLAIVMKVESHNHPSAIEPFQGAATGVGGIVRDIFAMGARPIALLNSLRFGPLSESRNRYLFEGVVNGISWYGNCIGVPDVGGEVYFSEVYSGNPLVNAMCVGIVDTGSLMKAKASGSGNLLILVGADTGRDGIHGASGLASRTFEDDSEEMRPTVQVGNPFLEKVLIEACLEAVGTGKVLAMQDLGAAGLTSTVVESVARGGAGAKLNIDMVPRREKGMSPYEVMLSESQERMLLVVKPHDKSYIEAVFEKWDLDSTVIGEVTDDEMITIYDASVEVASLPVRILTEPPLYKIDGMEPEYFKETRTLDVGMAFDKRYSAEDILLKILAFPDIARKQWIFRQYDHQVQTNTLEGPGADAAVLRIKGTNKAIAVTNDGNGRFCYLDPYVGGAIAVAEACRNLSTVGAEPIAITDCLNFGNPERPDVYFQLEQCVKGIAAACKVFDIPVVSGNVSLYNETRGTAIWPTPVIGALGILENASDRANIRFQNEDDIVIMLGSSKVSSDIAGLSGSAYLEVMFSKVQGVPSIDLDMEFKVQKLCRDAIKEGLINSSHDVSDGGLAVALAESCVSGNIGFRSDLQLDQDWQAALFGESHSRIIISMSKDKLSKFETLAGQESTPWILLGVVGGNSLKIGTFMDISLEDLDKAWSHSLQESLS